MINYKFFKNVFKIDIYIVVYNSGEFQHNLANLFPNQPVDNWYYDNEDEPSFYCYRTIGKKLTWGICRRNVRTRINEGDFVVFFSRNNNQYFLSGFSEYDTTISQLDIWLNDEFLIYQQYFNLLIRIGFGESSTIKVKIGPISREIR